MSEARARYIIGRWWFPKDGPEYFVTLYVEHTFADAIERLRMLPSTDTGDVVGRYGAAELRTEVLDE
jgi:hypothetical protein